MRKLKRYLLGLVAVLIGLPLLPVLLVMLWGGWLVAESMIFRATGDQSLTAAVSAPVRIDIDQDRVPHIFAETLDDAAFALGYLHARDRLFQMEMTRRIGAGRIAEAIGPPGLGFDRLMRTLGLYRLARADFAALAPEVQHHLHRYADGVNHWLETRTEPLPIEFRLLMIEPEPWQPADSLVWGKLIALQLSGNYRAELRNVGLYEALGAEGVSVLFPDYPDDAPVSVGARQAVQLLAALPPPLGPERASNAWASAAGRTTTGGAILAGDPHLSLSAPVLWYLARIETPEGRLTGGTVPGVPFLVIGHNHQVAWSLTTTGSDVQDLFIEQLDPDDPTRYRTPDGWQAFATREETILVRFAADETLRIRASRHGPILSDIDAEAAEAAGPGQVIALAWPALTAGDRTAEALYRMNRASDAASFREALRLYRTPQQNIVYADAEGTIGFIAPALIPIRPQGDGLVPVPGAEGAHDWQGHIPFDALPQQENPAKGFVQNANNRIVGPDYPFFLSHDWAPPWRAERIETVLSGSDRQDIAFHESLLGDSVSHAARELVPLMTGFAPQDARARQLIELLQDWDFTMARALPQPLIFAAWVEALGPRLWADETDGLALGFGPDPRAIAQILSRAPGWCDDTRTPPRESCAEQLEASLLAADALLSKRWGRDPSRWRWGEAHRAPLAHQLFGFLPGLRSLVSANLPVDGGNWTVNRAAYWGGRGARFPAIHGAGLRMIVDVADPDRSVFIIAAGQSGDPTSPHFHDFAARWAAGEHRRLALSAPELREATAMTVRLRPAD